MSELTIFRNHCRDMAVKSGSTIEVAALWTRLADEIDAYLSGPDDEPLDLAGLS